MFDISKISEITETVSGSAQGGLRCQNAGEAIIILFKYPGYNSSATQLYTHRVNPWELLEFQGSSD